MSKTRDNTILATLSDNITITGTGESLSETVDTVTVQFNSIQSTLSNFSNSISGLVAEDLNIDNLLDLKASLSGNNEFTGENIFTEFPTITESISSLTENTMITTKEYV